MALKPEITQKAPYGVELAPGTYAWCSCGRSKKQPLCDGSHKGSRFVPKQFVVDDANRLWLCGCKHSANAPFCDGTHKAL